MILDQFGNLYHIKHKTNDLEMWHLFLTKLPSLDLSWSKDVKDAWFEAMRDMHQWAKSLAPVPVEERDAER